MTILYCFFALCCVYERGLRIKLSLLFNKNLNEPTCMSMKTIQPTIYLSQITTIKNKPV